MSLLLLLRPSRSSAGVGPVTSVSDYPGPIVTNPQFVHGLRPNLRAEMRERRRKKRQKQEHEIMFWLNLIDHMEDE